MGFGAILVNLPGADLGILQLLYDKGIANELFPLVLFLVGGLLACLQGLYTSLRRFLFC